MHKPIFIIVLIWLLSSCNIEDSNQVHFQNDLFTSKLQKGYRDLSKGLLYVNAMEYSLGLQHLSKAKKEFWKTKNTIYYFESLLNIVDVYVLCDNYSYALFLLEQIKRQVNQLNLHQKSRFKQTLSLVQSYFTKNIVPENINTCGHLDLLNAHVALKNNNLYLAEVFLANYNSDKKNTKPLYYYLQTLLYLRKSNNIEALNSLNSYNLCIQKKNEIIKEFIDSETKSNKTIFIVSFASMGFLLLLISSIILSILIKERKNHNSYIKQLEKEIERYKKIKRKASLNHNALTLINERLEILNSFIKDSICGNHSVNASLKLQDLMIDKFTFLNSNKASLLISHPKFISHLELTGLTNDEVCHCCLYAIGLNGKDIANYMGWKRGYDKSMELRKKLGISKSNINLGTYIRELMNSLD